MFQERKIRKSGYGILHKQPRKQVYSMKNLSVYLYNYFLCFNLSKSSAKGRDVSYSRIWENSRSLLLKKVTAHILLQNRKCERQKTEKKLFLSGDKFVERKWHLEKVIIENMIVRKIFIFYLWFGKWSEQGNIEHIRTMKAEMSCWVPNIFV